MNGGDFNMAIDQSNQQYQQHTQQQVDPNNLYERKHIMTIQRPNFLEAMKEKCLTRLSDQRRDKIKMYRQNALAQDEAQENQNNGSEAHQYYDYHTYSNGLQSNQGHNQQEQMISNCVNNEILHQGILQSIIQEELNNQDEISIDEFNQDYQEIFNELQSYLAKELIESSKQDEVLNYEKYQDYAKQQAEQLAETYDPSNNEFYICAVCKGYVYRNKFQPSRIQCEKQGCIDIDLRIENFRIEDVMNMVMKVLMEHRDYCREQGNQCCREDQFIKVKVGPISDEGQMGGTQDEEESQQLNENDCMAMFLSCDSCMFLDFVALY